MHQSAYPLKQILQYIFICCTCFGLLTLQTNKGTTQTGSEQLFMPAIMTSRTFETNPTTATFDRLTGIAQSPNDERFFITEQTGRVQLLQPTGEVTTFLDLRDKVIVNSTEQGLLGITFDPNYAQNGYFYVSYIGNAFTPDDQWLFLSRFKVNAGNPNQADPTSERRIVEV